MMVPGITGQKKVMTFIPGNYYCWEGSWYQYMGIYKAKSDVPAQQCIYVIANRMYLRKKDFRMEELDRAASKKKRTVDNSRELVTDVRLDDNELMVQIKMLYRGTTLQQFKEMYPDVSDMNNARRTIECAGQGNLSWTRFVDFIKRKKAEYEIIIKVPASENDD